MVDNIQFNYVNETFTDTAEKYLLIFLACIEVVSSPVNISKCLDTLQNTPASDLKVMVFNKIFNVVLNIYGRMFDFQDYQTTSFVPFKNAELALGYPFYPHRTQSYLYILYDMDMFSEYVSRYTVWRGLSEFFETPTNPLINDLKNYYDMESLTEFRQGELLKNAGIQTNTKNATWETQKMQMRGPNLDFVYYVLLIILMPAIRTNTPFLPKIYIKKKSLGVILKPLVLT